MDNLGYKQSKAFSLEDKIRVRKKYQPRTEGSSSEIDKEANTKHLELLKTQVIEGHRCGDCYSWKANIEDLGKVCFECLVREEFFRPNGRKKPKYSGLTYSELMELSCNVYDSGYEGLKKYKQNLK